MIKTLNLSVPPAAINIIKVDDVNKFMEKCFTKEYPIFSVPRMQVNAVVCQSYADYGPEHWMIFKKNPKAGTIAHEAIHVVDYLCDAYGIRDGEFRGYLMGYLVEQISKKR